jgi:hypothetical protein
MFSVHDRESLWSISNSGHGESVLSTCIQNGDWTTWTQNVDEHTCTQNGDQHTCTQYWN